MIFTMAAMIAFVGGCGLEPTAATTEAVTTPTTSVVTATDTATTVEPVDAEGILARVFAKIAALAQTAEIVPIASDDGWYRRADVLAAYDLYVEATFPHEKPFNPFLSQIVTQLTAVSEAMLAGLEPADGATYRFHTDPATEFDIEETDTEVTFALNEENAIAIDVFHLYRNEDDSLVYYGSTGIRIGFDDEGKIRMEFGSMQNDFDDGGSYSYFRYVEDDGYLVIHNPYLCPCFEFKRVSFTDGSTVGVERDLGESNETLSFLSFWTDPETEEYFAVGRHDGVVNRFVYRTHDDGVQTFRFDMDTVEEQWQWEADWNLMYATGWDSIPVDGTGTLYQNAIPVLEGATFLATHSIFLSYHLRGDPAMFTDAILNLSAYGMNFEGAELSLARLASKRAYALSTYPSMTVIDDVDFLAGDPYEQAKAFLPEWIFELAAKASATYDHS